MMRSHIILLALVASSSLSFGSQRDSADLAGKFDRMLSEQFEPRQPGATVLVAKKGKIIYKKAFGMSNLELNIPMQADHVFKIGSITKQFTAIAILQLMERGSLSLQDEITKYIGDYPTQGHTITIEHLLTHTSGIPDFAGLRDSSKRTSGDITPVEMINFFKDYPLRFAPGTKWEYSNSGYFLLGYIIEIVSGRTYGEFLEENIFRPLGMTNSLYASDVRLVPKRANGYSQDESSYVNASYISMTHPYAAGAILSTVEDLFKWNQALHSFRLVKKATLENALRRPTLTDGSKTNYGYGWRLGFIQESPVIWHGGRINGFITMAMYLPNEDVFIAVFSNCDCNSPEDITARMAALAIGDPFEYKVLSVGHAELSGFVGVYENEKGRQRTITVSDQTLLSQLGRGPRTPAKPYGKDKFFLDDNSMRTMAFTRGDNGAIQNLVMRGRDGHEVWNRTHDPIPGHDGVKVDEAILDLYVGRYEMTPEFTFSVTKEGDQLYVQATGQDKLEMFAESETKFFLRVNDAQFEFIVKNGGVAGSVLVSQGRRTAEAKRMP